MGFSHDGRAATITISPFCRPSYVVEFEKPVSKPWLAAIFDHLEDIRADVLHLHHLAAGLFFGDLENSFSALSTPDRPARAEHSVAQDVITAG